jgi:hypothetical protein
VAWSVPCDFCKTRRPVDRALRVEVIISGKLVHAWACSKVCKQNLQRAYAEPIPEPIAAAFA